MSSQDDSNNQTPSPPGRRNGLRLVKNAPDTALPMDPNNALRPGLKNPLVKFMTAYAEAIERDIQTILEL